MKYEWTDLATGHRCAAVDGPADGVPAAERLYADDAAREILRLADRVDKLETVLETERGARAGLGALLRQAEAERERLALQIEELRSSLTLAYDEIHDLKTDRVRALAAQQALRFGLWR